MGRMTTRTVDGREQPVEYLTCAETAKLVRAALKAEFPGVKFSVRSKTYSGGASISVGWTDGPTSERVKEVCNRYEGADFDGMVDLKTYRGPALMASEGELPRLVSFGADFVMPQRDISDEFRAKLEAEVAELAGKPYDPSERYDLNGYGGTLAIDTHQGEWGSTLVFQLAAGRER